MNILDCDAATRSSQNEIANITPIVLPKTRSVDSNVPDTCLYIVNFKDNGGFAVMSADKRTEPIYALLDSGNYVTGLKGDSIYKPIINASVQYTGTRIANYNRIGTESEIGQYDPSKKYRLSSNCTPRLRGYSWYGGDPFNAHCPIINTETGERALAGCGPVALGTIVSYFKIDPKLDGYTIDHNLIPLTMTDANTNPQKKEMVSQLLYRIGLKVKANYNENGKASEENIWNYLKDLDIKYKTGFKSFTNKDAGGEFYTTLKTSSKALVLMKGVNSKNEGHMWIVDGLKRYDVIGNYDAILSLYHCVWGWQRFDGYYLQHIITFMGFHLISSKMYEDVDLNQEKKEDLVFKNNLRYCALSKKLITGAVDD